MSSQTTLLLFSRSNINEKKLHTPNDHFFSPLAIAALGDEEQLAMAVGQQLARMQQPVKVIHKEHEAVTAFCINKVSR